MGGVARSELAAAVAMAGGYGSLGMVREPPDLIAAEIDAVRAHTDRNFSVNVIPAATDRKLLEEQLAVCFDKQVHAVSLFWDVDREVVELVKSRGLLVLHQVGSVEQAEKAADAGADVIVAQGFEAGGHVHGNTTSLALLPRVANAVDVPVVASGGFATGESLVAAWALGASGIQCGTALLATKESFAHDYHKERVVEAREEDTVHTEIFGVNWPPHSPVRVLENSVTRAETDPTPETRGLLEAEAIATDAGRPILRTSTDSPLRTTSGDLEALALFAGQCAGQIEDLPSVAQRIETIVAEAERTLRMLRMEEDVAPEQAPQPTTGGFASPPCYLHELDDADE